MNKSNNLSILIFMLLLTLLIILCQAEIRYELALSKRTKRYGYEGFGEEYPGNIKINIYFLGGGRCCQQCGMCGGGYSYQGGYGMRGYEMGGCGGYCGGKGNNLNFNKTNNYLKNF
jgi:hypothetical protein